MTGKSKKVIDEEVKMEHTDDHIAPKFYKELKLAILNAPVVTTVGKYVTWEVPIESARLLANSMTLESSVGHESTAKTLSKLLEVPIEFTREELKQKVGQMALIFKLKKRPPEGVVLNRQDLEKIGYKFWIMYRAC